MVLQIYSLIHSIIVSLKNQGIYFHQYSFILHMKTFIFKIKLKGKFLDVE